MMHWNVVGSQEVYFDDENGRIEARVFKTEKGMAAMLTPVNLIDGKGKFYGYFITLEDAKAYLENMYTNSNDV